jgi:hypothetical protein
LSRLIRLGVSSLFRLEVSSLFRMDVSMLFSRPFISLTKKSRHILAALTEKSAKAQSYDPEYILKLSRVLQTFYILYVLGIN